MSLSFPFYLMYLDVYKHIVFICSSWAFFYYSCV